MVIFGSVCSGIEAASVAWEPLGWKAGWLAEIEEFPSAVLSHHYPDVPNLGDMTKIAQAVKNKEVLAPDVLVGGTPCQAFSVAGMREGLADPRGELTIRYVELADAIDTVRHQRGEQPAIIVWENVPGVLSSKDNAFGCFLGALAGQDGELQPTGGGGKRTSSGCVYGSQRAVAWRVLDAQYFGLAQRRKRVFLVASARDGFDPSKILFEFEGVRRDSAPSREAGETTTHPTAPCLTASGAGVASIGDTRGQDPVVAVSQQGFRMVAFGEYADDDSASTMKARDYKDATDLVCVHGTQDPIVSTEHAHALGRNGGQENAVLAFRACGQDGFAPSDLSPTLLATDGGGVTPSVYYSHESDGQENAILQDIVGALDTQCGGQKLTEQTVRNGHVVFGIPGNWIGRKPENGGNAVEPMHDISPCLTSTDRHAVAQLRVRRLTPVECERLQGFPDSYTQISWKGKLAEDCPDGHRYKALGNSMAVPCMRWIGERIVNYLSVVTANCGNEEDYPTRKV